MRPTLRPLPALCLLVPSLLGAQDAALPADCARAARLDLAGLRQLQARLALADAAAPGKAYAEAHVAYQVVAQTRARDPKGAEALLDRTIQVLQARRDADSLALRGACLGLKIGFQPAAAMRLAPEAGALFEEARALAPANPRVRILHAIHVLHTPAFFGGGAARALPLMEAAVKAADAEAPSAEAWAPSWGPVEGRAWLALARLEAGDAAGAQRALEEALARDPRYAFALAVLKPKVEKALAAAAKASGAGR
ncbi:MAG: hypothetical protein U0P81_09120 [Holophagaceae bacterium]